MELDSKKVEAVNFPPRLSLSLISIRDVISEGFSEHTVWISAGPICLILLLYCHIWPGTTGFGGSDC